MLQIVENPARNLWQTLAARPALNLWSLMDTVKEIFDDVAANGDKAVIKYTEKYDNVTIPNYQASEEEINGAEALLPEQLKVDMLKASMNILKFHSLQRFETNKVETTDGVTCWQKALPIEKVGLYIPGGRAPLFSTVMMLCIPASVAGCKEIILCTPPNREGKIHPAILFAAKLSNVKKIYKAGGIQAIAAMALGTDTVPRVYKLFGPGNQYVTAAKQYASFNGVAVDMPAGPSEVLVIGDETSNPEYVAADLLAQAEHGPDSQSILVTTSKMLALKVAQAVDRQILHLSRKSIIDQALANSRIVVLKTLQQVIDFSNLYAPEHLIVEINDYELLIPRINNAASVFLGHYTPESAGDYASGANHTLPTNGNARAYSGVNYDSFVRKVTFQEITNMGIKNLGPVITTLADHEELDAHSNSVRIRIKDIY
ncbi:MAG: histidinol dehydrogenase [Tannerellaceae bacterium]|jgi:histidinol dehydrogenase|nr:histidinol dehydrogenase [Tannerellaceae bacterium]